MSAEANADQRLYWNETMGPTWGRYHRVLDGQLGVFGLAAMDRAALREGERVIDVGCGTGETSIELARRVGSRGAVLGVDLSAPLLSIARQTLAQANIDERLEHVRFEQADASAFSYEGEADVVFSRFGVMFFDDPKGAFAHLRRKLRPGGRLSIAVWRAAEHNPWMVIPLMAIAPFVTLPSPTPDAPGPLAFADQQRVTSILDAAGFQDISFEAHQAPMAVGGAVSLDEAVDFILHIGPAARALREAPAEVKPAAKTAIHEALAPFHTPRGLMLPGGTWLITARNP